MEMTTFSSQICLIPGEQIMKYCLKLISRCRQLMRVVLQLEGCARC